MDLKRKIHFVKSKTICIDRDRGSSGVRYLSFLNEAFVCKLIFTLDNAFNYLKAQLSYS